MKTGFIGGGKMAEAMISAFLGRKLMKGKDVIVGEIKADRRRLLQKRYGVHAVREATDVVRAAEIVILAVKPQELPAVLEAVGPLTGKQHLIISIAAGKRVRWIESMISSVARVVRVMPNLPCVVGAGMSAYCLGTMATAADGKLVETLLTSCGRVLKIPERMFDAVTALSGSGPAFFAYLLDRMAVAGEEDGLSRADALLLAEQTMLGTAKMLLEQTMDPAHLVDAVASPKGTTAAGLAVLDDSEISGILRCALQAAARRSREISEGR